MTAIADFGKQSELALAAYAGLFAYISGEDYRRALRDVGNVKGARLNFPMGPV